jgi:hypothetical protein
MTTNKTNEKPLPTSTLRPALLTVLEAAGTNGLRAVDARRAAVTCAGGDVARDAHNVPMHDSTARGLIELAGARGVYRITDAGRAVLAGGALPVAVKAADATPETPETPETDPTPDAAATMARAEEPADAPVAEEPAAPAKRRLKVANAPAPVTPVDVPAWLSDDEIRAMVVENSECFGAWSARSNECGRCSLAGWCRNAKASTLALLASKLSTETPANPGAVSPAVAKLDGAVGAANAPDASRTAPPTDGRLTMKARHDNVCAVTGRPIKVGDAVKYAPGVGMYHASETLPADAK